MNQKSPQYYREATINAGRNGADKIQKLYGEVLCRIPPLSVSERLERRAEELQAQSRRKTSRASKTGAGVGRIETRSARQGNMTNSVAAGKSCCRTVILK